MPDPAACPTCGAPVPAAAPAGECPACLIRLACGPPGGRVPPTPDELQPHFADLEILDVIGVGGMGAVYRVRNRTLGRTAAMKLMHPEKAADPDYSERFLREARAHARLAHPHIVGVYDFGRAGDLVYLLMEYVDGVTLRDLVAAGRLTPAESIRVVGQVCDALQYAHDRGVIHRDVKPENVLVTGAGDVKLTDFGLARCDGDERTRLTLPGDRLGTARYMAPEQWADTAAADHRADLYSLGVLFYELLTGELPTAQYKPPSEKAGTDRRLDRVVSKSLKDEPDERYQRAAEIKTDVDRIAAPPRTRGRWWAVGLAGAVGAIGAAAVFAVLFAPNDGPPDGTSVSLGPVPAAPRPVPPTAPPSRAAPPPTRVAVPITPPITPAALLTSPDWEWTPPENAGAAVNGPADEGAPCPSADGLTMVFHSDRPGGRGRSDLWEARRAAPGAPFATVTNLGPAVNGPAIDESPSLSADGLTLAFASTRPGGVGRTDVWVARRAARDAPWQPPENPGPNVNSKADEYRPWLSADGLALTFASLRPPEDGVWRCTRPDPTAPFGPAKPLGKFSHKLAVGGPSFAADGQVVLVHRFPARYAGDMLWLGKVESPDEPFRRLGSFGRVVNGPAVDTDPAATADGRAVFFASDRLGGAGGRDIWVTHRRPKP